MASKSQNDDDRRKTIWNLNMDRYFVNLMLEQLRQGTRFDDPLFCRRAWKEMTSLFIAKFNLEYRKDILKNRYKSMRKLYRALKSLLDQEGFTWDETRSMVTADTSVWEEYLKLHPEAHMYKMKSVPYFRDLCIIFEKNSPEQKGLKIGDESPDSVQLGQRERVVAGNGSDDATSGFGEPSVDEDNELNKSNGVNDTTRTRPKKNGCLEGNRVRTSWKPEMNEYFIKLVLENVKKGNQIEGLFPKEVWEKMIGLLNAKFGFNLSVDVLKNHYKTLRRLHSSINRLLKTEGFTWDDSLQMVIADDIVWQDYIETHKHMGRFMTKSIPHYKDLCVIFSDSSSDGIDDFAHQNLQMQNEGQSEDSHSADQSGSCQDEIGDLSPGITTAKNKRQRGNSSDTSTVKKSRGNGEGTAADLENHEVNNSNAGRIEKVVTAVQALPDMDDDFVLDACDLLEDESQAARFMALDVRLRKKWLLRKLRPCKV